jgi:hypothetical protein
VNPEHGAAVLNPGQLTPAQAHTKPPEINLGGLTHEYQEAMILDNLPDLQIRKLSILIKNNFE